MSKRGLLSIDGNEAIERFRNKFSEQEWNDMAGSLELLDNKQRKRLKELKEILVKREGNTVDSLSTVLDRLAKAVVDSKILADIEHAEGFKGAARVVPGEGHKPLADITDSKENKAVLAAAKRESALKSLAGDIVIPMGNSAHDNFENHRSMFDNTVAGYVQLPRVETAKRQISRAISASATATGAAMDSISVALKKAQSNDQFLTNISHFYDVMSLNAACQSIESLHSFEAIKLYIAISVASSYSSVSKIVADVLKLPTVEMYTSEEERNIIRKLLGALTREGKINRKEQKSPIFLRDIREKFHEKKISREELAHLLIAYYAGLRKSEAEQVICSDDETPSGDKEFVRVKKEVCPMSGKTSFFYDFASGQVKSRGILESRVRCICHDVKFGDMCLCKVWDILETTKVGDIKLEPIIARVWDKGNHATHSIRIAAAIDLWLCGLFPTLILFHLRWLTQEMLPYYARHNARFSKSDVCSTNFTAFKSAASEEEQRCEPLPPKVVTEGVSVLAEERIASSIEKFKSNYANELEIMQSSVANLNAIVSSRISWMKCEACGKWRSIAPSVEALTKSKTHPFNHIVWNCVFLSTDCSVVCDHVVYSNKGVVQCRDVSIPKYILEPARALAQSKLSN